MRKIFILLNVSFIIIFIFSNCIFQNPADNPLIQDPTNDIIYEFVPAMTEYLKNMKDIVKEGETKEVDIFESFPGNSCPKVFGKTQFGQYLWTALLTPYQLGQTEVTGNFWIEVRKIAENIGYNDISYGWFGAKGWGFGEENLNNPAMPVINISYYDVLKWLNALSEIQGLKPCYYVDLTNDIVFKSGKNQKIYIDLSSDGYRLPTFGEWIYAAKRKKEFQNYSWGNEYIRYPEDYKKANYLTLENNEEEIKYKGGDAITTVPGRYPRYNGLYDMCGNVFEYIFDTGPFYTPQCNYDFWVEKDGIIKKIGGSFNSPPYQMEIHFNNHSDNTKTGYLATGFRIARSILAPDYPVINGVINNGVYTDSVTPLFFYRGNSNGIEISGKIKKNNDETTDFISGTTISEEGDYTLTVTARRISSNLTRSISVKFTINKTAPLPPVIKGVKNGERYLSVLPSVENQGNNITFSAELSKNGGEFYNFILGNKIIEEGFYVLRVKATNNENGLTNNSSVSFFIKGIENPDMDFETGGYGYPYYWFRNKKNPPLLYRDSIDNQSYIVFTSDNDLKQEFLPPISVSGNNLKIKIKYKIANTTGNTNQNQYFSLPPVFSLEFKKDGENDIIISPSISTTGWTGEIINIINVPSGYKLSKIELIYNYYLIFGIDKILILEE